MKKAAMTVILTLFAGPACAGSFSQLTGSADGQAGTSGVRISVPSLSPEELSVNTGTNVNIRCAPRIQNSASSAKFAVLSQKNTLSAELSSSDSQPATLALRDFVYAVFPQLQEPVSIPDNMILRFLTGPAQLTAGDDYLLAAQEGKMKVEVVHATRLGHSRRIFPVDALKILVTGPKPGNNREGSGTIKLDITAGGLSESVTLHTDNACITRTF
jgi:hypothetical protein